MELIKKKEIIIKKSRFITYFYQIESIEEANKIIENLWQEHKKARHIPYAYKVKGTGKKTDDKEPSGTAGTPIWNVLERNKLENHLIAVVRYFGGIKLGSGPLLRAYSNSANEVLKND